MSSTSGAWLRRLYHYVFYCVLHVILHRRRQKARSDAQGISEAGSSVGGIERPLIIPSTTQQGSESIVTQVGQTRMHLSMPCSYCCAGPKDALTRSPLDRLVESLCCAGLPLSAR